MNFDNVFNNENEKPLDNIVDDGGYTAIFRKICCIGDSLSSGEFETVDKDGTHHYHDMFEYSWGQFIARMCGSKVYNFSRGGMTAKWYCESFANEKDFWNPEYASQCYIIALGVNDLCNQNYELGSINDIDFNDWHNNSKKTFAGYYGMIMQRMKEIEPEAKFFLVTMPRGGDNEKNKTNKSLHQKLLYEMSEKFSNTYVIDLFKYAPEYDEKIKSKFYLSGHMNPMGYLMTAKMIASYIDYIIRHNMDDFKSIGFIGSSLEI